MGGILGAIDSGQGPLPETALAVMAGAMSPGGRGSLLAWSGQGAALGEMRSHTGCTKDNTGQENVRLRPHRADGLVLAADLRLTGQETLARALGLSAQARDMSDEELLLAAWRRWGEGCIERLRGVFAFALWEPSQRRLVLARDIFGQRPLAYSRRGGRLVFASTARGVVAHEAIASKLDPLRVVDFLSELEAIDHRSTFFRKVWRLPPAHYAVFASGRLRLERYWVPRADPEWQGGSDADALEGFTARLDTSVRSCIRGPEPVAVLLSGGLDSAGLVALARDQRREAGASALLTLSGVNDDTGEGAETRYIHQTIDAGGLDATRVELASVMAQRPELGRLAAHVDEPFDSLMTLVAALYATARERGIRAVLDGIDGDLVMALPQAYPHYLLRAGHPLQAWREHRGQARNYYCHEPSTWRFLRGAAAAVAPRSWRRFDPKRWAMETRGDAMSELRLVAPALARAAIERMAMEREASAIPRDLSLREAAAWRLAAPYASVGIERYERLGAMFGIEARKPIMDRDFVEFCLSLPWNLRQRDGWSKFMLRRLIEQRLPAEIAWRRGSSHLGWDFNVARLRHGREEHLERLQRCRGDLHQWVAGEALDGVIEELQSQPLLVSDRLRLLVDLAAWLEHNGYVS